MKHMICMLLFKYPHKKCDVVLHSQLNDKPIQHREVMNFESDLFLSYFKTIELLSGGLVGHHRTGVHVSCN